MDKHTTAVEPLISVIVATYRRDKSLNHAISSLLCQSYENIEVVVIDDNGSPAWNKKVEAVLENFKEDTRIVYIQNEKNQGAAKARNTAINAAHGEYITFLDDDDIYLPDKIKNQLNCMLEIDADYSTSDLYFYNEDGSGAEYRKRRYLLHAKQSDLLKYHLMYHITGNDTLMFKKSYLDKIGGFDPIDVGDDYYLIQKAIMAKGVLAYVPRSDLKAFIHTGEGGLSSGQQKIDGENHLFEYKKQFFDQLDGKSIRYIKMRHYAVIAFAYLRIHKFQYVLINGMKSFAYSPIECIRLILERKKK